MIEEKITVGLVVECRRLRGEWGGFAWRAVTVLAAAPEVEPWTVLGRPTSDVVRYYAGAFDVQLYSTETTNYFDTLDTDAPKLWVVLRPETAEPPVGVLAITADPAEGEANTEAGSNVVDVLEMPYPVASAIAEFVTLHHVERPVIKRRRDRAEPDVRWREGSGTRGGRGSKT